MSEFDAKSRKWAYDELSKSYNMGTEAEFNEAMGDPDNLKWAYDELSKNYNMGSEQEFKDAIYEAPKPATTKVDETAKAGEAKQAEKATTATTATTATATTTTGSGQKGAQEKEPTEEEIEQYRKDIYGALTEAEKTFGKWGGYVDTANRSWAEDKDKSLMPATYEEFRKDLTDENRVKYYEGLLQGYKQFVDHENGLIDKKQKEYSDYLHHVQSLDNIVKYQQYSALTPQQRLGYVKEELAKGNASRVQIVPTYNRETGERTGHLFRLDGTNENDHYYIDEKGKLINQDKASGMVRLTKDESLRQLATDYAAELNDIFEQTGGNVQLSADLFAKKYGIDFIMPEDKAAILNKKSLSDEEKEEALNKEYSNNFGAFWTYFMASHNNKVKGIINEGLTEADKLADTYTAQRDSMADLQGWESPAIASHKEKEANEAIDPERRAGEEAWKKTKAKLLPYFGNDENNPGLEYLHAVYQANLLNKLASKGFTASDIGYVLKYGVENNILAKGVSNYVLTDYQRSIRDTAAQLDPHNNFVTQLGASGVTMTTELPLYHLAGWAGGKGLGWLADNIAGAVGKRFFGAEIDKAAELLVKSGLSEEEAAVKALEQWKAVDFQARYGLISQSIRVPLQSGVMFGGPDAFKGGIEGLSLGYDFYDPIATGEVDENGNIHENHGIVNKIWDDGAHGVILGIASGMLKVPLSRFLAYGHGASMKIINNLTSVPAEAALMTTADMGLQYWGGLSGDDLEAWNKDKSVKAGQVLSSWQMQLQSEDDRRREADANSDDPETRAKYDARLEWNKKHGTNWYMTQEERDAFRTQYLYSSFTNNLAFFTMMRGKDILAFPFARRYTRDDINTAIERENAVRRAKNDPLLTAEEERNIAKGFYDANGQLDRTWSLTDVANNVKANLAAMRAQGRFEKSMRLTSSDMAILKSKSPAYIKALATLAEHSKDAKTWTNSEEDTKAMSDFINGMYEIAKDGSLPRSLMAKLMYRSTGRLFSTGMACQTTVEQLSYDPETGLEDTTRSNPVKWCLTAKDVDGNVLDRQWFSNEADARSADATFSAQKEYVALTKLQQKIFADEIKDYGDQWLSEAYQQAQYKDADQQTEYDKNVLWLAENGEALKKALGKKEEDLTPEDRELLNKYQEAYKIIFARWYNTKCERVDNAKKVIAEELGITSEMLDEAFAGHDLDQTGILPKGAIIIADGKYRTAQEQEYVDKYKEELEAISKGKEASGEEGAGPVAVEKVSTAQRIEDEASQYLQGKVTRTPTIHKAKVALDMATEELQAMNIKPEDAKAIAEDTTRSDEERAAAMQYLKASEDLNGIKKATQEALESSFAYTEATWNEVENYSAGEEPVAMGKIIEARLKSDPDNIIFIVQGDPRTDGVVRAVDARGESILVDGKDSVPVSLLVSDSISITDKEEVLNGAKEMKRRAFDMMTQEMLEGGTLSANDTFKNADGKTCTYLGTDAETGKELVSVEGGEPKGYTPDELKTMVADGVRAEIMAEREAEAKRKELDAESEKKAEEEKKKAEEAGTGDTPPVVVTKIEGPLTKLPTDEKGHIVVDAFTPAQAYEFLERNGLEKMKRPGSASAAAKDSIEALDKEIEKLTNKKITSTNPEEMQAEQAENQRELERLMKERDMWFDVIDEAGKRQRQDPNFTGLIDSAESFAFYQKAPEWARLMDLMSKKFGLKLDMRVPVDKKDPLYGSDGYNNGKGVIELNMDDAGRDITPEKVRKTYMDYVTAVMGHEITHTLFREDPEAMREFVELSKKYLGEEKWNDDFLKTLKIVLQGPGETDEEVNALYNSIFNDATLTEKQKIEKACKEVERRKRLDPSKETGAMYIEQELACNMAGQLLRSSDFVRSLVEPKPDLPEGEIASIGDRTGLLEKLKAWLEQFFNLFRDNDETITNEAVAKEDKFRVNPDKDNVDAIKSERDKLYVQLQETYAKLFEEASQKAVKDHAEDLKKKAEEEDNKAEEPVVKLSDPKDTTFRRATAIAKEIVELDLRIRKIERNYDGARESASINELEGLQRNRAKLQAELEAYVKEHNIDEESLQKTLLNDNNLVSLSRVVNGDVIDAQASTMPVASPWPSDFPDKITIHTVINSRTPHANELREKAKAGDVEAATELVQNSIKPERVMEMARKHPNAVIAYVHANEASGRNVLPGVFANFLSNMSGLPLEDSVVQVNKPKHTGASENDRTIRQARFGGKVIPGQEYIICDDQFTAGGTLRCMREYIESQGGKVVDITTLTCSQRGTQLKQTQATRDALYALGVDDDIVRALGMSDRVDNLTEGEAKSLIRMAKFGPYADITGSSIAKSFGKDFLRKYEEQQGRNSLRDNGRRQSDRSLEGGLLAQRGRGQGTPEGQGRSQQTNASLLLTADEVNSDRDMLSDIEHERFSLRQDPAPKRRKYGYKAFKLIDGQLYPPQVDNTVEGTKSANKKGKIPTDIGLFLNADVGAFAGKSEAKERGQVRQTNGSNTLSFRPGWHLGYEPFAKQFLLGNGKCQGDIVYALVEFDSTNDYSLECDAFGMSAKGKFSHALAGVPYLPENGYYEYRTNVDPTTDAWAISGAMRVLSVLSRAEEVEILRRSGIERPDVENDKLSDEVLAKLNGEIDANLRSTLSGDEYIRVVDGIRDAKQMSFQQMHDFEYEDSESSFEGPKKFPTLQELDAVRSAEDATRAFRYASVIRQGGDNIANLRGQIDEAKHLAFIKAKDSVRNAYGREHVAWLDSLVDPSSKNMEMTDDNGNMMIEKKADGRVRLSARAWKGEDPNVPATRDVVIAWAKEHGGWDIVEKMDQLVDMSDRMLGEKDENGDYEYKTYAKWANTSVVLDKDGNPAFTIIKKNGEYPLNIDASTTCKKREETNAVLNDLIAEGLIGKNGLSKKDIVALKKIITKHGLEIACDICFVDERRYQSENQGKTTAKAHNLALTKYLLHGTDVKLEEIPHFNFGKDKTLNTEDNFDYERLNWDYFEKTLKGKVKPTTRFGVVVNNLLANHRLAKQMDWADFVGTEGRIGEQTSGEEGKYAEALFNKVGASIMKRSDPQAQNLHQILTDNAVVSGTEFTLYPKTIGHDKDGNLYWQKPSGGKELFKNDPESRHNVYLIGGVRLQSFSDAQAWYWFDDAETICDLALKQLGAHKYTKELWNAKAFGKTGLKQNLSAVARLLPEGSVYAEDNRFGKAGEPIAAGLDEHGNPLWADHYIYDGDTIVASIQSIDVEGSKALHHTKGYSADTGVICVGTSDEQIISLQEDPLISMIIGFHTNLKGEGAKTAGLDGSKNYVKSQHERSFTSEEERQAWLRGELHSTDDEVGKNVASREKALDGFNYYEALERYYNQAKEGKISMKEVVDLATNEYLHKCWDKKILPEFDQYAWLRKDSWHGIDNFRGELLLGDDGYPIMRPGYYKHITDYCIVDGITGEYAPQRAVTMTFPDETDAYGSFETIIRDAVKYFDDIQLKRDNAHDTIKTEYRKYVDKRNAGIRKDATEGLKALKKNPGAKITPEQKVAIERYFDAITSEEITSLWKQIRSGVVTITKKQIDGAKQYGMDLTPVEDSVEAKMKQIEEGRASKRDFTPGDDILEHFDNTREITPDERFSQELEIMRDTFDNGERFSIRGKRKEEMRATLDKRRKDLSASDRAMQIMAIEALGEQENGKGDPKLEKIATYWVANGNLTFHSVNDVNAQENAKTALAIAEAKHIDPFTYKNPLELIQQFKDWAPKQKPIDPHDVPEFHYQKSVGDIDIYIVDDNEEGQLAVRKVIDSHWGKDANPWCLAARDKETGDFYPSAYDFWHRTYNGVPKRIAFRNGKLEAFNAQEPRDSYYDENMGLTPSDIEETDEFLEMLDAHTQYADDEHWGKGEPDGQLTLDSIAKAYGDEAYEAFEVDPYNEGISVKDPALAAELLDLSFDSDYYHEYDEGVEESEMTWWDRQDLDHNGFLMTDDLGDGKKGEHYVFADGERDGEGYERIFKEDKKRNVSIEYDTDEPDKIVNAIMRDKPEGWPIYELQRYGSEAYRIKYSPELYNNNNQSDFVIRNDGRIFSAGHRYYSEDNVPMEEEVQWQPATDKVISYELTRNYPFDYKGWQFTPQGEIKRFTHNGRTGYELNVKFSSDGRAYEVTEQNMNGNGNKPIRYADGLLEVGYEKFLIRELTDEEKALWGYNVIPDYFSKIKMLTPEEFDKILRENQCYQLKDIIETNGQSIKDEWQAKLDEDPNMESRRTDVPPINPDEWQTPEGRFSLRGTSEDGTRIYQDRNDFELIAPNGERYSIRGWHGTAADFDHFDFSFMGTGEGAQVFGWGGYIGGTHDISKHYANVAYQNAKSRMPYGWGKNGKVFILGSADDDFTYAERIAINNMGLSRDIDKAKARIQSDVDRLDNTIHLNRLSLTGASTPDAKKFYEERIAGLEKNRKDSIDAIAVLDGIFSGKSDIRFMDPNKPTIIKDGKWFYAHKEDYDDFDGATMSTDQLLGGMLVLHNGDWNKVRSLLETGIETLKKELTGAYGRTYQEIAEDSLPKYEEALEIVNNGHQGWDVTPAKKPMRHLYEVEIPDDADADVQERLEKEKADFLQKNGHNTKVAEWTLIDRPWVTTPKYVWSEYAYWYSKEHPEDSIIYKPQNAVEKDIWNYIEHCMGVDEDTSYEDALGYARNQITDAPDETKGWTDELISKFEVDRSNFPWDKINPALQEMRSKYREIGSDVTVMPNYLSWDEQYQGELAKNITTKIEFMMARKGLDMNQVDWNKASSWDRVRMNSIQGRPISGEDVYKAVTKVMGSPKNASLFLSDAGFTGIKVSTGFGHRGQTHRTKNYVIFKEEDAKIVNYDTHERWSQRVASSDPFYSNAAHALVGLKQEKAPGMQWLAMLQKAGGLKAEEDKWLGLSDWLRGKKSVTKQEVMDFIEQNSFKIEEVHYSQDGALVDGDELNGFYEELPPRLDELHTDMQDEFASLKEEGMSFDEAYEAMAEKYGEHFRNAYPKEEQDPDDDYIQWSYVDELEALAGMRSGDADNWADAKRINDTRLTYTTDGLTNKREIALVVPGIEPYTTGSLPEIHFADEYTKGKAVAWIRFGEATANDGKKVLVIDEIQSQRHQDGREKGYKENYEAANEKFNEFRHAMQVKYEGMSFSKWSEEDQQEYHNLDVLRSRAYHDDLVPDAPFRKNWQELAMKRMLRYAAENGYDKIAWTTGEQQAERYQLSRLVSSITWENKSDGKNVLINLEPSPYHANQQIHCVVGEDGKLITPVKLGGTEATSLEQIVGKEIAKRIINNEGQESRINLGPRPYTIFRLKGDGLKVGGEGMKGFYDDMLPRFMAKYGKKWGAKVGEITLDLPREADRVMHSVDVTPEMKESVMQGQPRFSLREKGLENVEPKKEEFEVDKYYKSIKVGKVFKGISNGNPLKDVTLMLYSHNDINEPIAKADVQYIGGAHIGSIEIDYPASMAIQKGDEYYLKGADIRDVVINEYLRAQQEIEELNNSSQPRRSKRLQSVKSEEVLKNNYANIANTQELFVTLHQNNKIDYDAVDEIKRRLFSGEAKLDDREEMAVSPEDERGAGLSARIIASGSREDETKTLSEQSAEIGNEIQHYAEARNLWIPQEDVEKQYPLSFPEGTSAHVYFDRERNKVCKLAHIRDIQKDDVSLAQFIDGIFNFNHEFPETAYTIKGFSRDKEGRLCFVLEQDLVQGDKLETLSADRGDVNEIWLDSQLKKARRAYGFGRRDRKEGGYVWTDGPYEIDDTHGGNIIYTPKGSYFIIDADVTLPGKDGNDLYFTDTTSRNSLRAKRESSQAFKRFFGDWEKDPESASKVVDEEGRPLVVHHGTYKYGFTVFNTLNNGDANNNLGSHFGGHDAAAYFTEGGESVPTEKEGEKHSFGEYNVYLNIRKPYETYDWFGQDDGYPFWEAIRLAREANSPEADAIINKMADLDPKLKWLQDARKAYNEGKSVDEIGEMIEDGYLHQGHDSEFYQGIRDLLKMNGYDGIKYWNDLEGEGWCWIALEPNQIKSADTEGPMANNGEFDPNNPDIRYSQRLVDSIVDPEPYDPTDLLGERGKAYSEIYSDPKLVKYRKDIDNTAKLVGGRYGDATAGAFAGREDGTPDPEKLAKIGQMMLGYLYDYRDLLKRTQGYHAGELTDRDYVYEDVISHVDDAIYYYGRLRDGEILDHSAYDIRYSKRVKTPLTPEEQTKVEGWIQQINDARALDAKEFPEYVKRYREAIAQGIKTADENNQTLPEYSAPRHYWDTINELKPILKREGFKFGARGIEKVAPKDGRASMRDLSGTKLVDKEGKPLKVYHSYEGDRETSYGSGMIFATADEKFSKEFGGKTDEIYLNIQHPYETKDDIIRDETDKPYLNADGEEITIGYLDERPEIVSDLMKRGFDGIIGSNNEFIVAFNADQVVSASSDIRYSGRGRGHEIESPKDFVADNWRKLNQQSLRDELGWRAKDYHHLGHYLSGSGITIKQASEEIYDDMPEGFRDMCDDQDVRDWIIEILGEGGPARYFKNKAEYDEEENLTPEQIEQRDQFYQEAYGMSFDEYVEYEEDLKQRMRRMFGPNKRPKVKRIKGESASDFYKRQQAAAKAEQDAQDASKAREQVIKEIQALITSPQADAMSKGELNRLLRQVSNATPANLFDTIRRAQQVSREIRTRMMGIELNNLLKLKTQDRNGKNMSIAKNVDDTARQILDNIRDRLYGLTFTDADQSMRKLRSENFRLREENRRTQILIDRGEYGAEGSDEHNNAMQTILDNEATIASNNERIKGLQAQRDAMVAKNLTEGIGDVDEAIRRKLEYMDKCADPKSSETWTADDTAELTGLEVLQARQEVEKIDQELRQAKEEQARAGSASTRRAYDTMIDDIERRRVEAVEACLEKVRSVVETGKASLYAQKAAEIEHRQQMVRGMMSDIDNGNGKRHTQADLDKKPRSREGNWKALASMGLGSFEYMAHRVDINHLSHDGWFYKTFVTGKGGVIQAQNDYIVSYHKSMQTLQDKTEEIFGKKIDKLAREMSEENEHSGVTTYRVLDMDEHGNPLTIERVPETMSKAEALYLHMVWKMGDGRAKMQEMGFDELSMQQIEDFIGPKATAWANWIQGEYLPELFKRYNARYKEIYGTPMTDTENYVPLKISQTSIQGKGDLSGDKAVQENLNIKNGSMINRTMNLNPIDLSTNAFQVILDHVNEAEEFIAFANVRKDLTALLNNKAVRNQLNANVAGQADALWKAAEIATHAVKSPTTNTVDELVNKIGKGVIGANIAFRNTTALKQMLSVPAFLGYSQDYRYLLAYLKNVGVQYGENSAAILANMASFGFAFKPMLKPLDRGEQSKLLTKTIAWCAENVPSFFDRIMKGNMGMDILNEDMGDSKFGRFVDAYLNQGMGTNKLVDAVTCAIGIKTIFDYRFARLREEIDAQGLKGKAYEDALAEAKRMALMEADIYYNGTQQSNNAAFMAPMQLDRTTLSRMFSVYQNASMGYARKAVENWQNLAKVKNLKRIINTYTNEYEAGGMSHEEAVKKAKKRVSNRLRKSAFGLLLYGLGMNAIWDIGSRGLLGFWQNDDEKEKLWDWSSVISYPLRGLPLMNASVNFINKTANVLSGDGLGGRDYNPLLLISEINNIMKDAGDNIKNFGWSPITAAHVMSKGSKLTGFDLNVWGNTYMAIDDMIRKGLITHENIDWMTDLMLFLQTPNSLRPSVAKQIYGMDPEKFAKLPDAEKEKVYESYANSILYAMKYTDEGTWRSYIPGTKILTEDKRKKLLTELWNELIPEDVKAKVTAGADDELKEVLKTTKEITDLDKLYDTEKDPIKRKQIAKSIKKAIGDEKDDTSVSGTGKKLLDQYFHPQPKKAATISDADAEYLRRTSAKDYHNDLLIDETLDNLKELYIDKLEDLQDKPEQYDVFYGTNEQAINFYYELKAMQKTLNSLKKGLGDPEADKTETMKEIRKARAEAVEKIMKAPK